MASQSHGIHFFKVILENTLQKGQLKVPTSFTRRHWQGVTNPVILCLPNGTKQKVYWLKHGCDIWLCNGWKEFAEYLCLDVSHFVVFRYKANSSFNVIIFGKNALEIEYPSTRDTNEEVEEIDDNDFSAKFVEEHTPLEDERPKFPSLYSRTGKRKVNPKKEPDEEDEPKHWKKRSCLSYSKQNNSGSCQGDFKKRMKMFHKAVKKMFHPENEHFTCLIQKTYTERDLMVSYQWIFPNHKEGNATLFVGDDRTWVVGLKHNYYGQLTFYSGWRKFLLENKLKIGDVCGFELHNIEDFSFKVTIYPIDEYSNTPLFEGQQGLFDMPSSSLKISVTPKASKSKLRGDLCICIKSSHLPTIPFKNIRSYVNESCSEIHGRHVTLRVGGRSWLVKLLCYDANSFARFSSGWAEFARECDLKEGDVCILKIIDMENLVFQVTFLKGKNSGTPKVVDTY